MSHWDVEHNEVQIDFEQDRVRNIQARIRRTRAQPATGSRTAPGSRWARIQAAIAETTRASSPR